MSRLNPVSRASLRNLAVIVALVAAVTLMLMPMPAFANSQSQVPQASGTAALCSTANGTQVDSTQCLPSGRWGSYVGVITSRVEPSKGVIGFIANVPAMMTHTIRTALPNMFMMITQVCWSTALSLSQFAASFDPMEMAGATVDRETGKLIDNMLTGGIAATIAVVGIIAWLLCSAFDIAGGIKTASKRIGAMILCLGMLVMLGTGASKTPDGATSPATGSPWWVVQTINDTINKVAVNVDLDGLNDTNENMMAYDNPDGSQQTCQDYLWAMHNDYDRAASADKSNTSAVTKAVNRIWEETALRSWVTMQWGNPKQNDNTPAKVAENAQMAYCHVLDMQSNTDTEVQRQLTNSQLGTQIDEKTAKWIFSENGWISTLHSLADDGSDQDDRDPYVMQTRAGVFWETCGSTKGAAALSEGDGSGIAARAGWSDLIRNIGDSGTGDIKNAGKKIRVGYPALGRGDSLKDAWPGEDSDIMSTDTTTVCKAVLNPSSDGMFHRGSDGYGEKNQNKTNIGDAATLGWRFDVPNVGGTWREANLTGTADPTTAVGAAKVTTDYRYFNHSPDTLGAAGSVIGGVVNLFVWGALSVALIVSKVMLLMMAMFLAVAFLIRAIPVGEKPKQVLVNWAKQCGSLCMVGILYSILGNVATFICQLTLNVCSNMPSMFLYNVVSGISPILAMSVLGMFCSKVLKIGNPFKLSALMGVAGAGALGIGAAHAIGGGLRMAKNGLNRLRYVGGGKGKHTDRKMSTRGNGNGSTAGSEKVLDRTLGPDMPARKKGGIAERWSNMSPDTVRGSLADAATRNGSRWSKLGDEIGARRDPDKWMADIERYKSMGLSEGKAERLADIKSTLGALTPKTMLKGIGNGIYSAGSFARAAINSQPLRDVAGKTLKIAATAGLTAAALTNPLTMPLGMAGAAKLALDRDVHEAVRSHAQCQPSSRPCRTCPTPSAPQPPVRAKSDGSSATSSDAPTITRGRISVASPRRRTSSSPWAMRSAMRRPPVRRRCRRRCIGLAARPSGRRPRPSVRRSPSTRNRSPMVPETSHTRRRNCPTCRWRPPCIMRRMVRRQCGVARTTRCSTPTWMTTGVGIRTRSSPNRRSGARRTHRRPWAAGRTRSPLRTHPTGQRRNRSPLRQRMDTTRNQRRPVTTSNPARGRSPHPNPTGRNGRPTTSRVA